MRKWDLLYSVEEMLMGQTVSPLFEVKWGSGH